MSSNRKMKVYKAADGWRWQLWQSSDIVADSGQAYANRGDAVRMAKGFFISDTSEWNATFEVEDCEEEGTDEHN